MSSNEWHNIWGWSCSKPYLFSNTPQLRLQSPIYKNYGTYNNAALNSNSISYSRVIGF